MLSLDLFDSRYERDLREGAVDDLEARRIDDLNAKMDDLIARAREAKTPEHKAGLKREFDKVKDERNSYFKVRNKMMDHGSLGEAKADYNFDAEDLKRLERIRDLPTLKTQAFELISRPSAKPMKPEKVEWFKNALEKMNSPLKVIKLMYDLLLSGEGHAVVGSKSSMNPNSYRQRFGEEETNQAGIPGNVPTEKIPGKEELLKGRGRNYYEDQKKNSDPVDEHGGGIGPRQHWQSMMPETALNPQDPQSDYEAKRQALHDLSLNKDVDQAAVLQRRLDLDREAKAKGITETVVDVKSGMAKIYRRLAPKIERHRDSFLAGQLYDELENYAELHGAEREFKQMMNGARNRAHMEYDTNPGGFQNWFWFLPFEDNMEEGIKSQLAGAALAGTLALGAGSANARVTGDEDPGVNRLTGKPNVTQAVQGDQVKPSAPTGFSKEYLQSVVDGTHPRPMITKEKAQALLNQLKEQGVAEGTDDIKKRMSKLEALALAANRAGDDAKCKMYQQKIQSLKQKLSQSMDEGFGDSPVAGAITRRIMSQHLDLLKQYGPELVGAAVDDVADYVGDVDEIGSSDVSGWVAQVERMLRENPPEAFREGWSDAIVARRTGQPRTPYSVYIKGRKWKDFENDDHAEAVANKLRAKFKADGRDPSVITIAPTDMSKGVTEDQDTSGVEQAILKRIMVAHLDLLRQYGPEKVMQAAEEVAYNVGDVDEIGTSDVSAYVQQVKQILGAVA